MKIAAIAGRRSNTSLAISVFFISVLAIFVLSVPSSVYAQSAGHNFNLKADSNHSFEITKNDNQFILTSDRLLITRNQTDAQLLINATGWEGTARLLVSPMSGPTRWLANVSSPFTLQVESEDIIQVVSSNMQTQVKASVISIGGDLNELAFLYTDYSRVITVPGEYDLAVGIPSPTKILLNGDEFCMGESCQPVRIDLHVSSRQYNPIEFQGDFVLARDWKKLELPPSGTPINFELRRADGKIGIDPSWMSYSPTVPLNGVDKLQITSAVGRLSIQNNQNESFSTSFDGIGGAILINGSEASAISFFEKFFWPIVIGVVISILGGAGALIVWLIRRRRREPGKRDRASKSVAGSDVSTEAEYLSSEPVEPVVEQKMRDPAPDEIESQLRRIQTSSNNLARQTSWSSLEHLGREVRLWKDERIWNLLKAEIIVQTPGDNFGNALNVLKRILLKAVEEGDVGVLAEASKLFQAKMQELLLDTSDHWHDYRWHIVQIADYLIEEDDKFLLYWAVCKKAIQMDDDNEYQKYFGVILPYLKKSKIHDRIGVGQEINALVNSPNSKISSRAYGMSQELGLS